MAVTFLLWIAKQKARRSHSCWGRLKSVRRKQIETACNRELRKHFWPRKLRCNWDREICDGRNEQNEKQYNRLAQKHQTNSQINFLSPFFCLTLSPSLKRDCSLFRVERVAIFIAFRISSSPHVHCDKHSCTETAVQDLNVLR